jgi:hypothetical protein
MTRPFTFTLSRSIRQTRLPLIEHKVVEHALYQLDVFVNLVFHFFQQLLDGTDLAMCSHTSIKVMRFLFLGHSQGGIQNIKGQFQSRVVLHNPFLLPLNLFLSFTFFFLLVFPVLWWNNGTRQPIFNHDIITILDVFQNY